MTFASHPATRPFKQRAPHDRRAALNAPTRDAAPADVEGARATSIRFNSSYIVISLTMMLLFINVTNLIAQYGLLYHNRGGAREMIRLFNVSAEGNIPSWFNSTLLLFNGILLGLILLARRNAAGPFAGCWGVLAAGFFYLSVDETSALHENLNGPMVELTRALGFAPGGLLTFAWPIAALVAVAVLAWRMVPFLRHLPRKACRSFLLAGAIFLSGAVLMEFIGGYMFDTFGYYSKGFALASTIEEFLEMSGLIIFADALLRYIRRHVGEIKINVR